MKIFVFDFTDKILPKEPYTQTMAYREEMDAVEMAVQAFITDLGSLALSTKCEPRSMEGYDYWYIASKTTEFHYSFDDEDYDKLDADRKGYPKEFLKKFQKNVTLMFAELYGKQTYFLGFKQYEEWITKAAKSFWGDIPKEFVRKICYEAPEIENLSIIELR